MEPPVTVITGTSKGIGKFLAQHYVHQGHRVIGCSRGEVDWTLDGYEHYTADVSDEKAMKRLFADIRKTSNRLDHLINNAGMASMNHSLLTPLTTVHKVLDTNVVGTFLCCREAAKLMKNRGYGRIVNFTTVAVPLKLAGEAIYVASKAAILSLTEVLARELAEFGITVNAIGPVPIETDLIRSIPKDKIAQLLARQAIPRLGTGEDVANVIDFFLKRESGLITGQNLFLGGVVLIDFLLEVFRAHLAQDAMIWRDQHFSYTWMMQATQHWMRQLHEAAVTPGAVVSLEADFSPNAVALMLALVEHGCIIVPLTATVEAKKPEYRQVAQVEVMLDVDQDDHVQIRQTSATATHEILLDLKQKGRPGLILFSSGSTGKSKAAVHDFVPLLDKFRLPRHAFRTLTFLLFDHIGGVNTLLYTLANAGCVITVQERSPDKVCEAIERYQVQLLPTSPTFINLLLVSEAYTRHDLSSLQMVTYGTEVMPESTLRRFNTLFPRINLLQTYGLSEVGILRSKSKSSDSLWVKVGGEGFATRVVDGMLEIQAQSAMLGYLNAPSPFTADGWFQTGDAVEVDGEYIRILGRKSELINVGGEKVYPAEVESVLQLMEGVADVMVSAEPSPITGQLVKALVRLQTGETIGEFRKRMWTFCRDQLPKYKIPQKVVLVTQEIHGERFKKMRHDRQEVNA